MPLIVSLALEAACAWRAKISVSSTATLRHERSQQHGAVVEHVVHADRLVEPDRRGVLGAHEEADGRRPLEQQPDQVPQRTPREPLSPGRWVGPHLLELYRLRGPGGRFGLEADHAV